MHGGDYEALFAIRLVLAREEGAGVLSRADVM